MLHTLFPLIAVASPIVLDGQFGDWTTHPHHPPFSAVASNDFTYLRIQLDGPPVNLQALDDPLVIALDWDDESRTGQHVGALPGVDVALHFSPNSGGVEIRQHGRAVGTWDDLGLAFAPTTASNEFELRMPRTLPGSEARAAEWIGWSLKQGDQAPIAGRTPVGQGAVDPQPATDGPLASPGERTRVVSWNLKFGNLIKERRVVQRLLAAMQPHILLIQEVESDQRHEDLLSVLQSAMPQATWTLSLGPIAGTLRSAIATRLPAEEVPALVSVKRRGEPAGRVRVAALAITTPEIGTMLACSTHLKCCGSAEGPEDLQRIGEVLAIRRAIMHASTDTDFDALVIGGDLNLVGSRLPLELLTENAAALLADPAIDGDLLITSPLQPDGSGLQTWQERGNRYAPGRLDFVMCSPNLAVHDALVFDTLDLPESALAAMRLVRTDAERASDHLPLIIDLELPLRDQHLGR